MRGELQKECFNVQSQKKEQKDETEKRKLQKQSTLQINYFPQHIYSF